MEKLSDEIKSFLEDVALSSDGSGTSDCGYDIRKRALNLLLQSGPGSTGRIIHLGMNSSSPTAVLTAADYKATQNLYLGLDDKGYRLTDSIYSGKIPAIKMLRTLLNCGLKEAKDAIENPDNFRQQ